MSEVSLMPGNTGGWGGDALAAGFGAFVGSMFGNGCGGWGGFGNRGNFGTVGAIEATALSAENAVLNNLNDLRTGVNNIGMNLIQGQGRDALTACQGFSGINQTILTSAANQTNWNNQGFAGLNATITQQSFDTRQAIAALSAQNAQCCCDLKQAIGAVGASITSKLDQNTIAALQAELCDAKAKNAALESQQFLTASQLAQNQYLISQLKTTTASAG